MKFIYTAIGLFLLSASTAAAPVGGNGLILRNTPVIAPVVRDISEEGYEGDGEDIVVREISEEGYEGGSEDIVVREISEEGYEGDGEDIVVREISEEGYEGGSEDIVVG